MVSRLKWILVSTIVLCFSSASLAGESGFSGISVLGITPDLNQVLYLSMSYTPKDIHRSIMLSNPDYKLTKLNKSVRPNLTLNSLPGARAENENNNILGMFINIGYGKLRYNIDGSPAYRFDDVYTKGGGISLEIPLLKFNEKFSVYNELGFSQFKATSATHYSDTAGGDPANNYSDVKMTFAPNAVTLSNIVRYTLTPGDFKYYVALGIYNSFVVSSTNLQETYRITNGVPSTTIGEAVPDPAVHGLMLLVCTGFSYRNIGFEVRFDPGHNYTNKLNYAVYMPAFNALLHVRFNPK